nr:PREDICTED: uncharacterized protein LOC109044200 isoform X1 [Bemisia tabaci]
MVASVLPTHLRMNPMQPMMSSYGGAAANSLCCCLSCFNLKILQTPVGILKISQVVVASICQSLLLNFGLKHALTIGFSFESFLSTVASCMMTSSVLLLSYVLSSKSYKLIRSSMFELLFNCMAASLYLSTSAYLWFAVNTFLYPYYLITPFYTVYPAMTAAYAMQGGGFHAADHIGNLANRRMNWVRISRQKVLSLDKCMAWCGWAITKRAREERQRNIDYSCHMAFQAFRDVFPSRERGACAHIIDTWCRYHNNQYQCTGMNPHTDQIISLWECVHNIDIMFPQH